MITVVSLKDALLESAREVFETMVFTALEPVGEGTTDPGASPGVADAAHDLDKPETCLLGSITFKGQLEGCLGVCCGEPCARTIASSRRVSTEYAGCAPIMTVCCGRVFTVLRPLSHWIP